MTYTQSSVKPVLTLQHHTKRGFQVLSPQLTGMSLAVLAGGENSLGL